MLNPRRLYTALLWLLLPYIFFHLFWRARKQPQYRHHIAERFGFYPCKTSKPVIWLHTVSVGETRAAASLVQRLQATYPDHQILLTHTTPTGREASEQLYGEQVLRVYLPYDYPFAIQRFLRHFKPTVGVLLETEIWFNLIHGCHTEHVPLLLLNARLSEKSAAAYARFSKLTLSGLSQLTAVAAQTEEDAARLSALGASKVAVMGNLKYDIEPPPQMLETGKQLRTQFGRERPIFLAASTRAGEEGLLLDALNKVRVSNLLTVIVPRHPQRFDEVAALLTQHGLRFQRRSENRPIAAETQVVLGDSMGEMFAYYAACDIAFIGGSLLPFGGQNLIEACALGKPVLIGLHTYNFSQATILAVEQGAAVRVSDAENLANTLEQFLLQPEQLNKMGIAGLDFVNANRGATEKALRLISQTLTHAPSW
jgi:3-deoxy-D-manno-octulosonic-acid transferase